MRSFDDRDVSSTARHKSAGVQACILFLWILSTPAQGAIHEVTPGGCIQDTVGIAQPGDTIVIRDGTYVETIVLYGKSLTIGSSYLLDGDTSHITETVISPDAQRPDTGSCFVYAYQEPPPNRLVGLTLSNGTGTYWTLHDNFAGGAIFVARTRLELLHCRVLSSTASYGGGVFVYGNNILHDASAVIGNSRIANCTSTLWGGGIYANYCSLYVFNSILEDDASLLQGGGGLSALATYVEMNSCEIRRCSGIVGGVECGGGGYIANSLFEENSTTQLNWAAHLALANDSYVVFNCAFLHTASSTRALMFCCAPQDYVGFIHNVVDGIELTTNPSGVIQLAGISGDVSYNRFLNSGGEGRAGVFYSFQGAMARIHHNWFEGNFSADSIGCVLFTGPDSHTALDSNIIAGNRGQTISYWEDFPTTIDARHNWWGHPSGPYHPTLNPTGQGDTLLSDSVLFIPWLTEPPDTTMPPNYLAVHERPVVARTWVLMDVYPNPFNSTIRIGLAGFAGNNFEITLHNLLGQIVDVVYTGPLTGGELFYTAPAYLASGVYFLKASDRHHLLTKKVVLMK